MKKALALLLGLVMLAGLLAACGGAPAASAPAASTPAAPAASTPPAPAASAPAPPAGAISVGIINMEPSESGYREANVADFTNTFTAENGYDAQFSYNAQHDGQVAAARQFITDGVQYLLIAAASTTGWDEVLAEAQTAGVKVFLFDRIIECDESLFEAAVISDMAAEGKTAVDWLKAQNLDVYNVIHIQGQLGSAAQEGRTGALQAEVDAGTMNLVRRGTGGDSWSADEAKAIVEAAITAGEEFNVIYAENDGMAEGAMKALDEANITHGREGDVIIMGFDCNRFALRYLLDGQWNYDGQCSPFQSALISEMIQKVEAGETLPEKIVINEEVGFDTNTITQADIDQFGIGE